MSEPTYPSHRPAVQERTEQAITSRPPDADDKALILSALRIAAHCVRPIAARCTELADRIAAGDVL